MERTENPSDDEESIFENNRSTKRPLPQERKTSSKSKEEAMMNEAISFLRSKNTKVQHPDEAFGMTSLRSISKHTK